MATEDSGPDHGSAFVHTPTTHINVVTDDLDSALEIGTRIAEADRKGHDKPR
ncbi:hypothetical protein ACFWNH_30265 [Rhodococcus qingshengii]|uniref:hypothetical protein n=1 Tax=Rhodococcus qingshengii TaxID=334542 RepID=UPI00365B2656